MSAVAAIDRNRIEPPYLQLAEILAARIESGQLKPGERVPSITTLMGEFDIGKNTAIRALKELRDRGLVEVRQGWGTFVRSAPLAQIRKQQRKKLRRESQG